jgi:uncharacterized protein YqfA (UPF0365 family)
MLIATLLIDILVVLQQALAANVSLGISELLEIQTQLVSMSRVQDHLVKSVC